MKYKVNFLVLIMLSFYCNLQAKNIVKQDSNVSGKQLFMQSEKVAMQYRHKIERVRFLDPIERSAIFFKIILEKSPDLYNNTDKYYKELIEILCDTIVKKDSYTDNDVIYLLYNLCMNNYIIAMDSVYSLAKINRVRFEILEKMIFQDFNVSNQVARNYKNPKLIQFLKNIKCEIEYCTFISNKKKQDFKDRIDNIVSGSEWNEFLKDAEKIQPPLLKPKDCKPEL